MDVHFVSDNYSSHSHNALSSDKAHSLSSALSVFTSVHWSELVSCNAVDPARPVFAASTKTFTPINTQPTLPTVATPYACSGIATASGFVAYGRRYVYCNLLNIFYRFSPPVLSLCDCLSSSVAHFMVVFIRLVVDIHVSCGHVFD